MILHNTLRITLPKEELENQGKIGKNPEERTFEEKINRGVIIMDKPRKVSSQDFVIHIKKMLKIDKASHVGTLDPNVTGVLPILLSKAVKINHYLSKKDKEYVVLMNIHKEIEEGKIKETLKSFEGTIEQLPPKKSAVKRRVRKRKIHSIEVIEIKEKRYVLFRAKVEAGTYMRALCRDFGKKLNIGAHMQDLRRTSSLGFSDEEALNFYTFVDDVYAYKITGREEHIEKHIINIEEVVKRNFKIIYLKDKAASAFVHGAGIFSQGIGAYDTTIKEKDIIGVFSFKNEFLGLGMSLTSSHNYEKKNVHVIKPLSIIASREDYPKIWK